MFGFIGIQGSAGDSWPEAKAHAHRLPTLPF